MTQSNISTTESTNSYLSLKLAKAYKTGSRSHGHLIYRVLTDSTHQHLFITIVGNDGAGCYSKEVIPMEKIERCLDGVNTAKPIASKLFQSAFVSRSANNSGFLAAILRFEKLLLPAPDAAHQHLIAPDWASWKTAMLALAGQAEIYQPEPPKPRGAMKTASQVVVNAADQPSQPDSSSLSVSTFAAGGATEPDTGEAAAGNADKAELDAAELALLDRVTLSDNAAAQAEITGDAVENTGTVLDKQQARKQRNEKRQHPTGQGSRQ